MIACKTYSECIALQTFEERFRYLRLNGRVGDLTFGSNRYLNQLFYNSPEWKDIRRQVIIRDNGCDLAIPDRSIGRGLYIHHLNPITVEQVVNRDPAVFDLENLICVSFDTHQAIHFGDENMLIPTKPNERKPNDTCPWKK